MPFNATPGLQVPGLNIMSSYGDIPLSRQSKGAQNLSAFGTRLSDVYFFPFRKGIRFIHRPRLMVWLTKLIPQWNKISVSSFWTPQYRHTPVDRKLHKMRPHFLYGFVVHLPTLFCNKQKFAIKPWLSGMLSSWHSLVRQEPNLSR